MRSRPVRILAGIVVVAAALRFWRIGHQSYWLDEAFTARIVRGDLGAMFGGVRHTESTPPLYYALAWLWERVFGWHEAGLRSLSALFGVATVPAAYAAARAAFASERAGLIGAALFAVNPYLVWYSQEARAYALLVLLSTIALACLLARRPVAWGAASALALATHYFAAFLVVPMAVWLLWQRRDRPAWIGVALPSAAALALLPLALEQRNAGHTLFIAHIPLGERLWSLPKKLATGELGTPTPAVGVAVGLALALGAVLALRSGPARDPAARLLGLTAAAVGAALVVKLAGLDYFFPRNLIEVFVPLLVAVAGGFAGVRAGAAVAAAVAVAGAALVIQVSLNASLQRDDWRGLVGALGPTRAMRAIVVQPVVGRAPLRLYAGPLTRIGVHGVHVAEIDLVANARPPDVGVPRPPPGFRVTKRRTTPSWALVRYRSTASARLGPKLLDGMRLELDRPATVLVQEPG